MRTKRGFSVIELTVVFAIGLTLLFLASVNLLGVIRRPSLAAAADTLVSDLRQQQTRAMANEAVALSPTAFGIAFTPGSYILFAGTSMIQNDPANSTIPLSDGIALASTFDNQQVAFAQGSGEVVAASPQEYEITLTDTRNGELRTIIVNPYGVVTQLE
jgi:type II secretory pathway pseudopilin PulG